MFGNEVGREIGGEIGQHASRKRDDASERRMFIGTVDIALGPAETAEQHFGAPCRLLHIAEIGTARCAPATKTFSLVAKSTAERTLPARPVRPIRVGCRDQVAD